MFSFSDRQLSWFPSLTFSTRTMGKNTITLFLVEKTRFTPPNIPHPAVFCSLLLVTKRIMHNGLPATLFFLLSECASYIFIGKIWFIICFTTFAHEMLHKNEHSRSVKSVVGWFQQIFRSVGLYMYSTTLYFSYIYFMRFNIVIIYVI